MNIASATYPVCDGDIVDLAQLAAEVITPPHPDPELRAKGVRLRLGVDKVGNHVYFEPAPALQEHDAWRICVDKPFTDIDLAKLCKIDEADVYAERGPAGMKLLGWAPA
jgi:hypothetical protein